MTSKGQLTIPKPIRQRLKLQRGCKLLGKVEGARLVLSPTLGEPEELFRDRPPVTRELSVEDMTALVREAARGRS
ncbi:MAG: AbrB/MazE/SpoVT family DNA-binding domain-containing protein [Deltaproteobacteria bacterium]|nr:AbrB/MazE/SpoVT family DNA-binding domain-containing protein [Deltaproteobacteria bacterium]